MKCCYDEAIQNDSFTTETASLNLCLQILHGQSLLCSDVGYLKREQEKSPRVSPQSWLGGKCFVFPRVSRGMKSKKHSKRKTGDKDRGR